MSEYPPGSVGFEFDRLDNELAQLQRRGGVVAVWAWWKRRKLTASRELMNERALETLRQHFLEPESWKVER